MVELGLADFDRLLLQTRRTLEAMTAARAAAGGEPGNGQAAEGRIRAVASGGQVQALELDPQVMRMPSQELATAVMTAVNAALAGQGGARDGAVDTAGVDTAGAERLDPRELAATVAEIQDQGIRQMAAIGQAISAAVARVQAGR